MIDNNEDKTRRFIEESFPTKEVSILSAHEKDIRRGNISSLHVWWARKPLGSSRATIYAALIPAAENEETEKIGRKFIVDLAKWENSFNRGVIDAARRDILEANGGVAPRVLDPFAGGGAIPLEALRLGCETYASELNPVAALIELATLNYPQKYATQNQTAFGLIEANPLKNDLKKWSTWVFEKARKELEEFYPQDEDGSSPIGYIWARTIPCQNPSCEANIPLMRQFWLARKKNKKVALFPFADGKEIRFKIIDKSYDTAPSSFDPAKGTISKSIATCLVCGSPLDANTTRRLFREGKSDQRMIAVVLKKADSKGKGYRIATAEDSASFALADSCLAQKTAQFCDEWGIEPVPDEPLPPKGTLGFRVQNYGILRWGDLFNTRQKLALITFANTIKIAHKEMLKLGLDIEYAKALMVYLGLIFDKLVMFCSSNCTWKPDTTQNRSAFSGRQTLHMTWDYFEMNPISGASTSWPNLAEVIDSSLNAVAGIYNSAICNQNSATSLPYDNDFFDAVFTDPPYYDNVPYSHLSDFFYVWLKRIIGETFPSLFSTQLTPKKNEVVAYPTSLRGNDNGKQFFELMLKKSFQEIHRVLKPNGIAIIVYAHKSTAGWETLINSLLDSNLIVTGAWPLNSEMSSRLRAMESAALASSIYIVARKMKRRPTAFYNDVKEELKKHLNGRLDHLWIEQKDVFDPDIKILFGKKSDDTGLFSGADFFIAALGFAIEVFGKYEKVIDYEGNIIRANKLLDDAQEFVTNYAVRQILHNGFGSEITDLTRFYVLWRWNYGEAKIPFDDARKLAQSCGIDLAQEWGKGRFIHRKGEFILVLGPYARAIESLRNSRELIDVLHYACLLWGRSERDEMINILDETGFGNKEAFYRVAQAISETLPNESKEKQLLEGFLAGKERIKHDIKEGSGQASLQDWQ